MKFEKRLAGFVAAALLAIGIGLCTDLQSAEQPASQVQTDVDRAQHLIDGQGVPLLRIAGVGDQRHPAWTAIYALAYAGKEAYTPELAKRADDKKFKACIDWLEKNLKPKAGGLWVWEYGFDNTYNDVTIRAPWSSAFAQATGIQALLEAYRRTGESKYLDLAKKASKSLFVPLRDGGLLFQTGSDVWFEEIPQPVANPSHILNGHMRVLLALKELSELSGDQETTAWLQRGTDTLYRWLPRYDTGYWLRYDLNPRKQELLFRFANPYGYRSHPMAVDKITLRDPASGEEAVIDVGGANDAKGERRIAGTDWGQTEKIDGRTVRKLAPVALENKTDAMGAPHSYFYLTLPGAWESNLREQWYELILEYYDDAPANITVQQRSIAPGVMFRDMRDGDLHLTGSGQWRKWIVPIRPSDLGYWVGQAYADKHASYLTSIAQLDNRFKQWGHVAIGYAKFAENQIGIEKEVKVGAWKLPPQTPMVPVYSLDKKGIVQAHKPSSYSRFDSNGFFDKKSDWGVPVYSPFIVANQLLHGSKMPGIDESLVVQSRIDRRLVSRKPALEWLLSSESHRTKDDAWIFFYPFEHVYNDVKVSANWPSAFGQAYVLMALMNAEKAGFGEVSSLTNAIEKTATAFSIPVEDGGVKKTDRRNLDWYEEVPNATHVLNAHLVSVPELSNAAHFLKSQLVQRLSDKGMLALRDYLYRFDAGYWLRYDQNPKKELLLQIDWLAGETSPVINEVLLQNPQSGRFVRLDIGVQGDAEGGARISGTEWQAEQMVDGKTVRPFSNGYVAHEQAVDKGTRHNAYLLLQLPEHEYADFFDVPEHRLIVRFKDVAPGRFAVKIQAIHEGNQLTFVPLRNGVWTVTGDQRWKETSFTIRPQDMGWYKGPDYQDYEVKQLQRIARMKSDWFFSQYEERQRYFLEAQQKNKPVIIETRWQSNQPKITVGGASPTYAGYGYENALDGDPNDDYTAGIEGNQHFLVLLLDRPADLKALNIHWENYANYARNVKIVELAKNDVSAEKILADVSNLGGGVSRIPLAEAKNVAALRIEFSDYAGQPRVLLRQISLVVQPKD